jgi:hypothetical protein
MSRFFRVLNTSLIFTVLCLASAAVAAAQANTSTQISTFPFSLTLTTSDYPCLQEDVLIYGSLREVLHITFDASGGRHRATLFNAEGLTAVGLTSGTEYQVTGPGLSIINDDDLVAPVRERTFYDVINLVGPGQNTNLLVRTGFHLTFNSNGDLVAFATVDSVKCR